MMITRFANLISRTAVMFAILFAISACGGGGGGGFNPDNDADSELYFLLLTLFDPDGNETDTITSNSPGTLEVRVTRKNQNGQPVQGVAVNTTATIGQVFPASGSALTNSNGIATFQIEAGNAKGAGTITSTANSPGGEVSGSLDFQVGDSDLRLGYIEDGVFMENVIGIMPRTALSSQGQAQLIVDIVDQEGNRVGSTESVKFESDCLLTGASSIDPASPVETITGSITTTYVAGSCSGLDQITATLLGGTSQAFGEIEVSAASAKRLTFEAATPELIVLKGTGGGENRQEFSDVTFLVLDGDNQPLPNVTVNFELSTSVGGLTFAPNSAITDSNGRVKVTVFSGDVATVVRVIATTVANDDVGEISTISDILTVSTGLPDQNSISVSVGGGGFVVENGMQVDGVTRQITVSMADKFNNPVPDGTAAVFTTEYGAIEPSCTTVNGTCTVTWRSQAPRIPTLTGTTNLVTITNSSCPSLGNRPGPCPDDLGFTRGGRSTILVVAIGEESFIDANGNGIMDEDEQDLFSNVPEASIDNNEDGVYTPEDPACQGGGANSARCIAGEEETYRDFNTNGMYDLNNNPAVYNGLLCPIEGDGVWCSRDLVNVRAQTVIILGGGGGSYDIALYRGNTPVNSVSVDEGPYRAFISDIFNNRPPSSATITVAADGDCELASPSEIPIANTNARGAFSLGVISVTRVLVPTGEQGTLTITLNQSDGTSYFESWPCFAPIPDPEPEP